MKIWKILNIKVRQLPQKHRLITSFLCALYIYLFFVIFTPFRTIELIYKNHLKFIVIPIIVFFVMLFFMSIPKKIFPVYFDQNNWRLKKQLIFIFSIFLCVATFVYLYSYFFIDIINEKYNFCQYLLFTIAIGVIPTLLYISGIIVLFNDEMNSKKVSSEKNISINENFFVLSSDDKKVADLSILNNDLVYIKSENNYCKIVYLENQQLISKLFRLTLKNAEKQLAHHENILRCHRSYIINKARVIKIEGNTKTAFIYLKDYKHGIPISRGSFNEIKSKIKI